MEENYVEIRSIHLAAATLSGLLLVSRSVALNAFGGAWARASWARMLALGVNTILLLAAAALTTIIGQYPLANAWLTVKALLLLAYLLLGRTALEARSVRLRWAALAGALIAFVAIIWVANAHRLGLFD